MSYLVQSIHGYLTAVLRGNLCDYLLELCCVEGEFSELLRGNLRECFCEIVVSLSSSKRGKLMGPPGVLMSDKLTKYLTKCVRVLS